MESLSCTDPEFSKKFVKKLIADSIVQIVDLDLPNPNKLTDFFSLDLEIKQSQTLGKWFAASKLSPKEGIEWKQGITYSNTSNNEKINIWCQNMKIYQELINQIAFKLMEYIFQYLDKKFPELSSTLRVLKYDKNITKELDRCLPHTDSGFLTIIWQSHSGLEILKEEKWCEIPYVPNGFIVQVGDMLELLSEKIFVACIHKVRFSSGSETRYSVPYFIEPLDSFVVPGANESYQDWLQKKFKRAEFLEYLT